MSVRSAEAGFRLSPISHDHDALIRVTRVSLHGVLVVSLCSLLAMLLDECQHADYAHGPRHIINTPEDPNTAGPCMSRLCVVMCNADTDLNTTCVTKIACEASLRVVMVTMWIHA